MTSSHHSAEFVALWSLHSKEIYAYIYSLVFNGADADDVFQETSLVLLQKFDEFEVGTNFPAWASRVAYHKARKLLERRRLPEFIDQNLLETFGNEVRPSRDEVEIRMAALAHCLAKLSPPDRQLIQQRYERGCTVESLAKKVGRSASLIYKKLARIHDRLLACVHRRLEGDRQ